MSAQDFIAAARSFLGASWAHQGRRPDRMDCIGLLTLSMAATGRLLRDRTDYGRTPHKRKLREELISQLGNPVNGLLPGDVVTIRWSGEEHHVAIVTDHPEGLGLIHCWRNSPYGGKVVEHRLDDQWQSRILEVFRPWGDS